MKMEKIPVIYDESLEICICSYGREDNWEIARWGKGTRDLYFLHYVLDGEGFFNGKKVKAGEGFYITPELTHEYFPAEEKPWRYFWVAFKGDKAEEICKKHIKINPYGIFEFPSRRAVTDIIDMIFEEKECLSNTKAVGYFYLLLSAQENRLNNNPNLYVENAKNYIDANYSQNPTVTEIADVLSISDRYLYNLFIKYECISPKQYLNDVKIKRASRLLKMTNQTISEIALSVGYDDIFAFSKFFKKNTGLSPTEYRKNI